MVGWMSGISHNFLRFVHTPSVVDRLWQCKPDYFGCSPHKCFHLGFLLVGGATKPHSDGESQNAFADSMIASFLDNWGDADFLQLSQEIGLHTLLPLSDH